MAVPPAMAEAASYAASRLASALSAGRGSPAGIAGVRSAVLAWWACENGWRWPPNARNNPGNIRPGLESSRSIGVDARNFLVFATPQAGVDAFVDLIVRGAPYAGVRSAIAGVLAGGSPTLIANAVGASPWGTNGGCMRSALPTASSASAGSGTGWTAGANGAAGSAGTVAAPAAQAAGSIGTVVRVLAPPASLASACTQIKIVKPSYDVAQNAIPVPRAWIGDPCLQCGDGWSPGWVDPSPGQELFGWTPLRDLRPGQWNACIRPGTKPGDTAGPDLPKRAGEAAGDLVNELITALGPLLMSVVWLTMLLALVLVGLYLLARS